MFLFWHVFCIIFFMLTIKKLDIDIYLVYSSFCSVMLNKFLKLEKEPEMKKTNFKKVLAGVLILLTGVLLLSTNASAVMPPYLFFDTGNYSYDATSKELSFSGVAAGFLTYTDGSFDADPILGATLSFGTLMNSGSNNLIFGPSPGGSIGPVDFSIDGFITAKATDFVVADSQLSWGTLYDIQRLDGGSSRYVDELLANGGGKGNIYISFTPTAGGMEYFTSTSLGSVSAIVAAPEPVSAILFVAGGSALAARRYRKRKKT